MEPTLRIAGTDVRNREDEHWEMFDTMPVVWIRLRKEFALQKLPRAAAVVS